MFNMPYHRRVDEFVDWANLSNVQRFVLFDSLNDDDPAEKLRDKQKVYSDSGFIKKDSEEYLDTLEWLSTKYFDFLKYKFQEENQMVRGGGM